MTAAVVSRYDVAQVFADTLRQAYGNCKSAAKMVARAADCTPRGAENLLAGRNAPNAAGLINLMRESDEFCITVLELAGRGDLARKVEVVSKLDAMLRTIERDAAE
jgi:hypothetical protein